MIVSETAALLDQVLAERSGAGLQALQALGQTIADAVRRCEGQLKAAGAPGSTGAAGDLIQELAAHAIGEARTAREHSVAGLQEELASARALVADRTREKDALAATLAERTREKEALAATLAEIRGETDSLRRELAAATERTGALALEHEKAVRARTMAEDAWEQVEADAHRVKLAFERRIREIEAELSAMRAKSGDVRPAAPVASAPVDVARLAADTADAAPPAPAVARVLTLVEPRQPDEPERVVSEAERQLETYVASLLDHLKTTYAADLAAEIQPATLVDRLMANLRFAREAYARRLPALGLEDERLLDRALTELMDAEAASSFGRHLAVALYVVSTEQGDARANAS